MQREIMQREIVFLSTLSLRRATESIEILRTVKVISIHALLAESDIFSPSVWMLPDVFLSTLSLRRATPSANVKSSP